MECRSRPAGGSCRFWRGWFRAYMLCIDTRVLRRISILLGRDFFKLYWESLDEEFGKEP